MKIGIVSDTHTNRELLDKAVSWLERRHKIPTLYHLGDEYEDVVDLAEHNLHIVQVPGIYHPKYRDGSLPATVIESVMGLRICLVHAMEKDLCAQDKLSSDIILHGHTHKPELHLVDGQLFMNPGHLKQEIDKNQVATFGLLDIGDKQVHASIFSLEGEEVLALECMRSENGLYKM